MPFNVQRKVLKTKCQFPLTPGIVQFYRLVGMERERPEINQPDSIMLSSVLLLKRFRNKKCFTSPPTKKYCLDDMEVISNKLYVLPLGGTFGRRTAYLIGLMSWDSLPENRESGQLAGRILVISSRPLLKNKPFPECTNKVHIDVLPLTNQQRLALLSCGGGGKHGEETGRVFLYVGKFRVLNCNNATDCDKMWSPQFNIIPLLAKFITNFGMNVSLENVCCLWQSQLEDIMGAVLLKKGTDQTFWNSRGNTTGHDELRVADPVCEVQPASLGFGSRILTQGWEKNEIFTFWTKKEGTGRKIFIELQCPTDLWDHSITVKLIQTFVCPPPMINVSQCLIKKEVKLYGNLTGRKVKRDYHVNLYGKDNNNLGDIDTGFTTIMLVPLTMLELPEASTVKSMFYVQEVCYRCEFDLYKKTEVRPNFEAFPNILGVRGDRVFLRSKSVNLPQSFKIMDLPKESTIKENGSPASKFVHRNCRFPITICIESVHIIQEPKENMKI